MSPHRLSTSTMRALRKQVGRPSKTWTTLTRKKPSPTIENSRGWFWSNVRIRPSGCWEWIGTKHRKGWPYGTFRADGKRTVAHRAAFYYATGRWPKKFACHKCDNPPCVNPSHLFDGDHLDNVRDCVSKGRNRSVATAAKLTKRAVRFIRRSYAKAPTYKTKWLLARRYNLNWHTVQNVLIRKTWRHVS